MKHYFSSFVGSVHQHSLFQFFSSLPSVIIPYNSSFCVTLHSRPYYSSFCVIFRQQTLLHFVSRPYYYWLSCHPPISRHYLRSFPITVRQHSIFQFIYHHPTSADHISVCLQTVCQFISHHPPSADLITVCFTSPPISRPYYSSFYVTLHQHTLF